MDAVTVRPSRATDREDLKQALIELQDVERALDDTRLPGHPIAAPYLAWMERSAAEQAGAIFVGEVAGAFAGFVACWVTREDNLAETSDSNTYGYLADLCVVSRFRGRGVAGRLLAAAERHLAAQGVSRLRTGVLTANTAALAAYRKHGFGPYETILEKRIALRP